MKLENKTLVMGLGYKGREREKGFGSYVVYHIYEDQNYQNNQTSENKIDRL
jgi:hypothetical protein